MKDIIQSLKNVHALAEAQLPTIQSRINTIIKSKSKDSKEIENLLDILLNYQFMEIGESEFKLLNKYYSTFDKQASRDWMRIQKELLKS